MSGTTQTPVGEIRDPESGSNASIAPALGFNCFRFESHTAGGEVVDVLDTMPDFLSGTGRPSGSGIPILFPFPNRIASGQFRWGEREYQLPLPPGRPDAIHGFCHDHPWRVTARDEGAVTGTFQLSVDAPDRRPLWPADFLIEVRYEVRGAALRSNIRVMNPDSRPLPWGFGTHPYFKLPLGAKGDASKCLYRAAAHLRWPLKDSLPWGQPVPPPAEADLVRGIPHHSVPLDHVYTKLVPEGNRHECVIVDEGSGLTMVQSFGVEFRELVVFTPPPRPNVVCLEPYTCTTNAINLEAQGVNAGWDVLDPGTAFETWIDIEVRS